MSRKKNHDLIFKALADNRRRKILDLLRMSRKRRAMSAIISKRSTACTVMQHLGVLEKAGLVIVKKEEIQVELSRCGSIREIYDRWINQYASPSVEVLANLKRNLEPTQS